MLRKIVSAASRTRVGRVLVIGTMATYLVGCGSSIGPIDFPSGPPAPDLSIPAAPDSQRSSGGGLGFGLFQRESEPVGVIAAPGTDWGYASTSSSDFAGLVVADEPQAALLARNILSDGGSAADAATALYFTLVATNPASASLGGGGICLVHDSRTGVARSVDFLPRAPSGGGPVAIPGAVRGFAMIHAEWGNLAWRSVVDPASALAARHTMSRTLANRLQSNADNLRSNTRLRSRYTNAAGAFLREGDRLSQPELAGSIGIIANRGAQDLYTGELGFRFIEEAGEAGGTLTTLDMQSYRPNIMTAQVVELPGQIGFVPAGSTGAGFFFPELTQKSLRGLPSNPAPGTPAVSQIQAEARGVLTESGIQNALPEDFGSTSFAVTDDDGLTIVCGLTMNGAFGTALAGRSTGIIYARSPSNIEYGLSGAFLTPLIATNPQGNRLHIAAAAGGGPEAAASLLYTAINARTVGLNEALSMNGSSATGTVNAISCNGPSARNGTCEIGVDPRGSGLGAEALR